MNRISRIFRSREADCVEVRQLSSDYLEGDLPPSRMERIRAHIAGCGPCQSFVQSLGSIVGMLIRLPSAEASPTFKKSLLDVARDGARKEEGRSGRAKDPEDK